jgi:hypothetical protein
MLLKLPVFFDRQTLTRVQSAILLGLVGSGLLACMLGAFAFDVSRLISTW